VSIPPWARHVFDGRSRIWKRFADPALGQAWVAQMKAKIRALKVGAQAASIGLSKAREITFFEAAALWLSENDIRPGTRKWYNGFLKSHLLPTFGQLLLSQIDRARVLEHIERRRSTGASPGNLGRDLKILRAVLNWGRLSGYETSATAWKVPLPKSTPTITRRFDPEAVGRFLAAATNPRDRSILEVAAGTGMRGGELRAFDCSWIRWHEGRIVIPHDETFSPKDREARNVPLHRQLEEVLRSWLGDRKEGLVFPPVRHGGGKGVARGAGLRYIFRKVRKASGVAFHGMHDLRHHYISMLAYLGRPIREIQEIAGHKDLSTTQGYTHVSPTYLQEARAALESVAEFVAGKKDEPPPTPGKRLHDWLRRKDSNLQPPDPESTDKKP